MVICTSCNLKFVPLMKRVLLFSIQYASGNNEFDVYKYKLINDAMYTEWKHTNDKKKLTTNNAVSDTASNNGDDLIKEIDNEEGEMDDKVTINQLTFQQHQRGTVEEDW